MVEVVEESPDHLGRWFAIYSHENAELFSARLLTGTDDLGIAWTSDIRIVSHAVAAIEEIIARQLSRVFGTPLNGLETVIKSERLNLDLYQRRLARHAGGSWRIEITRRSELRNEVWKIEASRKVD